MKATVLLCLTFATLFLPLFSPDKALAQSTSPTPAPAPAPTINFVNEFTTQNQPSSIVSLLKNFIQGFDSILGGFIFYTPDPLASTITLKDNSEIPGVGKYRDIFYQIAIPILAIIIAGIAITKIGTDNTYELKNFLVRFVFVIALFLTVPLVLSYSIQFNNLLVDKISSTQQFTVFLDNYFDKSTDVIANGGNSETLGIPSFNLALKGGILQSLGQFIVQIFLFALTFLFLLCGFIYLGFQFIIRFATLLFLGVIYPVILPFALAERTQQIVYTFFKTWFTFLIQQPAFVLGFAIATDIFNAILNAKGPSVGMLFFYTGFLFFLGGVNMLVARIFGDIWVAASSNMTALVAARAVSSPVNSSFNDFKKGLFGGSSISNNLGRQVRSWIIPLKKQDEANGNGNGNSFGGNQPDYDLGNGQGKTYPRGNSKYTRPNGDVSLVPPFSQNLSGKGLKVEPVNQKQGVVSVSGEAFKYHDNKTGLTSYYPTRVEAIQDGIPEKKLERVDLNEAQFIDLSSFNKYNPNPHNFNAMQQARDLKKPLNYAHIEKSSPPQKVKHFLEVSEQRNSALGVQGVIVERQAAKGTQPVIRMYSKDNPGSQAQPSGSMGNNFRKETN